MEIRIIALFMLACCLRYLSAFAYFYEDETACYSGDDAHCNGGLCSHWFFWNGRRQIQCEHCPRGQEGSRCERYIWESQVRDPCLRENCSGHGSCKSTGSKPFCYCYAGWKGRRCGKKDPCVGVRCGAHGSCQERNSRGMCVCQRGWSGWRCQVQDVCHGQLCSGHGKCDPKRMESGQLVPSCDCDEGFLGEHCEEEASGHGFFSSEEEVVDVAHDTQDSEEDDDRSYVTASNNPCQRMRCNNGGTCTLLRPKVATCRCTQGWMGPTCDQKALQNPCDAVNCYNGGTCNIVGQSAVCDCLQGWQGLFCGQRVAEDPCGGVQCLHGGQCSPSGLQPVCSCASGWHGDRCEQKTNQRISPDDCW